MASAGNEAGGASVAVAVSPVSGSQSRRAIRWAAKSLIPQSRRVVLLHVIPVLSAIPEPSGRLVPIERVNSEAVEAYDRHRRLQARQDILPFKKLCKTKEEVEILVLDGRNTADVLLKYVSESGVENLVLGGSTWAWLKMLLRGPDVPTTVLRSAPSSCNVFVVTRRSLTVKLANRSVVGGPSVRTIKKTFTRKEGSYNFAKRISVSGSNAVESSADAMLDVSVLTDVSRTGSIASRDGESSATESGTPRFSSAPPHRKEQRRRHHLSDASLEGKPSDKHDLLGSLKDKPPILLKSRSQDSQCEDHQDEVEKLRLELQNTLALYNRACEDRVHARQKVQVLSAECSAESRKVKDALQREEVLKQIAAEERAKHLKAVMEVKEARDLLAQETTNRHNAENEATKVSSEKLKIVNALLSSDERCRKYSRNEIEVATDNFSVAKKIGEGGFGNVYKGILDHTPVAVKVLREDAIERKEEFLKEVEVLSQLHHPHMLLLLGACPEIGCLVYEYMENGSLEDRLFCRGGTQPLPWFVRFRVIFEVACGLAFLHGSKPEPIVHRDLKPGNILLDRNYVSKIGDVGLARLMPHVVPDGITEYKETVLAGTLYYMDPEYQRTGTLRPKSDLYAFGIIILQLLTAKPPMGLLMTVENAIKSGSFVSILDKSISDWPAVESEKLAQIALRCTGLRCRDRPDLESEVIPELEELSKLADTISKRRWSHINPPAHFFCPILQALMDNPYIAADGFSYEYIAIKAWLEKHQISPVTRLKLQHTVIIQNHALRSAIQEWKSELNSFHS